jgi:23S rRNA (cytosine1962-C5)-methyltransferase
MDTLHLSRQVILKKNEDRRILRGHPWIFSNEIREIIGQPAIGDVVEALSAAGKILGVGFFNPHSLIAVRLLSSHIEEITPAFMLSRLERAAQLRRNVYPDCDAYRVVHGEADFLPGLIVDRFHDHLAVQTLSYGMDAQLPILCDILEELFHPAAIIERNDSPLRTMEGLPSRRGVLRGNAAESVTIRENSIEYTIDPLGGQKTGFFLDQKENRAMIGRWSKDGHVLDCFCNEGGFALNAARGGASSVLGVDSSQEAVQAATANSDRNSLRNVRFEREDAFSALDRLAGQGAAFDMVILDPPSFSRNKKGVPAARQGYRDLHARALRVISVGGYLASASCSHHIEPEAFLDDIMAAARKTGRRLQLLEWRGASPDHPTLPTVPETGYLKFGLFRVFAG